MSPKRDVGVNDDFDRRVQERIDRTTGPWKTRKVGPLTVRARRRRHPDFVAFDEALSDLGRELLSFPPGSWIVGFVWWLNGKLGGPSKPSDDVDNPPAND